MTGLATHGAVVQFDHVSKSYDPAAKKRGTAPGAVNDLSLTVPAGKICILVGPVRLRQDDLAQDGQPPHRADLRPDHHRRRRRDEPGAHRAPTWHRLRHPAGRPVPPPDDRRERRDGAAPAWAGRRRASASGRRSSSRLVGLEPGEVPRPLSEPAVRRRAAARRRRPGACRGPADHADGRAVRGGRSDRPRPPPERVPAPPGVDRQDDPVRHPRHRRGDQDGRPGRRLPGRRRPRPVRDAPRDPRRAGVGVRRPLRRPGPRPQAAVAAPRRRRTAPARDHRPTGRQRGRRHAAARWPTRSTTSSWSTSRTGRSAGSRPRTSRTRAR